MRIYIAGPLTDDDSFKVYENVKAAARVAWGIKEKNHSWYCPHLNFFLDDLWKKEGHIATYSDWMEEDGMWLDASNALFYMGPSPGADEELARAEDKGIEIFRSLEEVPDAT